MKKNIKPADALRIALDEDNYGNIKTYDLSRVATFFAVYAGKLVKEINERIQQGEIV